MRELDDGRTYFWTLPSEDRASRTTDPLGLDSMRSQLADRLVPCLTGRVWTHENFFWTLVLIQWARFEKKRTFSGIEKAREQSEMSSEPSERYEPLLKNPRALGLLGVHLGPLRLLGFVEAHELRITARARNLLQGVGDAFPSFSARDWHSIRRAFGRPRRVFGWRTAEQLRLAMHDHMPDLSAALKALRWSAVPRWGESARFLGRARAHAALAADFCAWADEVRAWFDRAVEFQGAPEDMLPPVLTRRIPADLSAFRLLRPTLRRWVRSGEGAVRNLARLHRLVFGDRGYGVGDLWVAEEERSVVFRPALATPRDAEGSDCRWANAVALMRPGSVA